MKLSLFATALVFFITSATAENGITFTGWEGPLNCDDTIHLAGSFALRNNESDASKAERFTAGIYITDEAFDGTTPIADDNAVVVPLMEGSFYDWWHAGNEYSIVANEFGENENGYVVKFDKTFSPLMDALKLYNANYAAGSHKIFAIVGNGSINGYESGGHWQGAGQGTWNINVDTNRLATSIGGKWPPTDGALNFDSSCYGRVN